MAHGAIFGSNGNMPARMRVGLAENHFLCGGLLLRGHGNSFSRTVWRDWIGEAHPFARFIANYKNCLPRSQTVKTEVPFQRDSTTYGAKLQPLNGFALTRSVSNGIRLPTVHGAVAQAIHRKVRPAIGVLGCKAFIQIDTKTGGIARVHHPLGKPIR